MPAGTAACGEVGPLCAPPAAPTQRVDASPPTEVTSCAPYRVGAAAPPASDSVSGLRPRRLGEDELAGAGGPRTAYATPKERVGGACAREAATHRNNATATAKVRRCALSHVCFA